MRKSYGTNILSLERLDKSITKFLEWKKTLLTVSIAIISQEGFVGIYNLFQSVLLKLNQRFFIYFVGIYNLFQSR